MRAAHCGVIHTHVYIMPLYKREGSIHIHKSRRRRLALIAAVWRRFERFSSTQTRFASNRWFTLVGWANRRLDQAAFLYLSLLRRSAAAAAAEKLKLKSRGRERSFSATVVPRAFGSRSLSLSFCFSIYKRARSESLFVPVYIYIYIYVSPRKFERTTPQTLWLSRVLW